MSMFVGCKKEEGWKLECLLGREKVELFVVVEVVEVELFVVVVVGLELKIIPPPGT